MSYTKGLYKGFNGGLMIGVVLGVCVSGVCCGVIAWCTFNKDVRIDLLLTLPNIHLSPPLFLLLPPSSSSFPFHPPPPSPVSYLFYATTLLRSTSYLYLPPSTPTPTSHLPHRSAIGSSSSLVWPSSPIDAQPRKEPPRRTLSYTS